MRLQLKSPLKVFKVNQYFGNNFNTFYTESGMTGHNGIDFHALDSTEVYATHDGRVTFTGYDGAGGLGVVIRTNEEVEFLDGTIAYAKSIYWHLKKDTIKVTGGQTVKAGDLIALADNTGRSTGAHLHFGLKPIQKGEQDWYWENVRQNNGYKGAIDPMPYFNISTPKHTFTQTLRKGSRGEEVKQLQQILNVYADGIFGNITKLYVMNFQREHKLKADGIVGAKTNAVLNTL
jgi:murein DD-endopeptidase MepM/ murein hydrolase activator NlpD